MKKIFLIGAGYVGSELALRLVELGYQVTIAKRNVDTGVDSSLKQVCRIVRFDAALENVDQDALTIQLLQEANCVVYCVSADAFTPAAYELSYVHGLKNVLKILNTEASPSFNNFGRRVVFVSSTGVYGQANGQRVDETSPTAPESFSGQAMLRAEQVLQAWASENPMRRSGVAIRFSGIYGPGRTRMIAEILEKKPVTQLRWQQMTNRIHRNDCARAIIHVIGKAQVLPVYVASDPSPTTFGELATWVASQRGQEPPAIDNNAPRSAALERGGHKIVWSTALLADGFQFSVPSYREGYGPLLQNPSPQVDH
jgi:nucleoside-diphosphate-sugar epimerase